MMIRDRIKELRRVKASELLPNPKNWRCHPPEQLDVLKGLMAEVGFAGAELCIETPHGLMLIDGHARAEVAGDSLVPCLITDLTQEEAAKVLATFDPVSQMADKDAEKLDALLRDVQTSNEAVASMLTRLAEDAGIIPAEEKADEPADTGEQLGAMTYKLVVTCKDEADQTTLLQRLEGEGYHCQLLMS